ncbi:ABC transporter ATP-binding protein [uncultured Prevotella sp.]|uniref:ABC transporter ATP-binding protein n=1 Tax=uncultured Prevotella sp. TaxID=159272 RepID=UPI00267738F3|nr:ABC transporter ATP-binding protein [uncultured Prevotella sp.]
MKIKNLLRIPQSKYPVKAILRWLWHAWRGNRLQAVLNAALGLLGVAASLMSVWAVQNAIDVASHVRSGSLYAAVALMGVFVLCDFGVSIASVWVRNILGIKAQNRMQQHMLDRILRSEWRGRDSMHSGDVLNRLELDVRTVVEFLTETMPNTLSVVALFLGSFFYLFSMDAMLAVVIVIMLPLFMLVSRLYVGRMRSLTRNVRNCDSRVQSVLQETIQNRMLIKTLEKDDAMVERLEATQSELRHNVVRRTAFSLFSSFVLNFGFAAGYLIAFLWGAIRMYGHTLSFGGMTAFLQLVARIQGPARNLTKLVPQFVSVLTAAERLMELEENPLEEQGAPLHIAADGGVGVRFENVAYAYADGEREIMNNFSFDFTPGSCTAVLGETGTGKTTLVRMILALIRPDSGRAVIYNGRGESYQLSSLTRCNFVYVPQGNTLLSGTIRDNLRLGNLSATDDDMLNALHRACADFVSELPDGLDTVCSESGGGLSEGQAQRIAIARALLRDGSVMLFDEATSSLDPDTERRLLANLLADRQRTIIFVTHRMAVVDYCDCVLRMERL